MPQKSKLALGRGQYRPRDVLTFEPSILLMFDIVTLGDLFTFELSFARKVAL